ncbi:hypothetical protein BCR34DRAFT_568310 [Clohesyomyces aquaticus]|uniref:Uncharacterized protein n=1 Tax=Clohesyomyces aquaticus TaxID=1231657 RepID=A0A1Y1ZGZ3_9PLEO|nr:hypothetical protein BCR34DRAFT_568310 [Clohesyomyces aquaticus]
MLCPISKFCCRRLHTVLSKGVVVALGPLRTRGHTMRPRPIAASIGVPGCFELDGGVECCVAGGEVFASYAPHLSPPPSLPGGDLYASAVSSVPSTAPPVRCHLAGGLALPLHYVLLDECTGDPVFLGTKGCFLQVAGDALTAVLGLLTGAIIDRDDGRSAADGRLERAKRPALARSTCWRPQKRRAA